MILFCYLLILFAQNHTIITNNTANYIKIKSVILPLNQYFFDISLFFSFSPQSYPRQAFTSLYIYMRKPGKSRNIRIKKTGTKKNQAKHSSLGFLYPEPGSNRHGLLHWCLRPARLPIPPSGPYFGCKGTINL